MTTKTKIWKPVAAALGIALLCLGSTSALAAGGTKHKGKVKRGADYVEGDTTLNMRAFVIPLIDRDGNMESQLAIRMQVTVIDDDAMVELRRVMPILRNDIYHLLFRRVSFRTRKPRIPGKAWLQREILPVVQRVAGKDLIETVVVSLAHVQKRE